MRRINVVLGFIASGLLGAAIATFLVARGRVNEPPKEPESSDSAKQEDAEKKKDDAEKRFDSIFFPLVAESNTVPVARAGAGGGLTSFGDAVLVLTHEGKIFSATSASDIKETSIQTPDNGYASYVRAAESERYRKLTHDFTIFRYNDILHYRSGTAHGLALSYTEWDADRECYGTAVAVLTIDPDIQSVEKVIARRADWKVIFRTQPCLPLKSEWRAIEGQEAGGRMAFRPPATLFLASGDYGWDGMYAPEALAQDPQKQYGKVMAIDLTSHQATVFSKGHRNPQGIALDRDGRLWVTEHGMRGGDELNLVVKGENYGWPQETMGTRYNRLPGSSEPFYDRHLRFRAPMFAWLPSVATSNLTLINGFHASWDGDLLMATLRDHSLYRIRVRDNRVLFAERIVIGNSIRYVHQHTDGRLVLWTDDHILMFLTVAKPSFVTDFVDSYLDDIPRDFDKERIKTALTSCRECHSLEPGVDTNAPSLAMIFNAPIASTTYAGYSKALARHGGRWSRTELGAFLRDPHAFAPGTTMRDPGIREPVVIDGLINLLEAVTTKAE